MGSFCSKRTSPNEHVGNQREKESNKSSKWLVALSTREEVVVEAGGSANDGKDGNAGLITKPLPQENVVAILSDEGENTVIIDRPTNAHHQRRATVDIGAHGPQTPLSRMVSMPNAVEGEQVAAGWPSWLTAVAGEAIKGWVPRRADSFEKLDKIGQGTYSSVYKARDLETDKIVAMKKVRFVNLDPESVRFMAREIHILRRLNHPNVMKLEGLVTSRMSCSLYLVFEYMEHDLAGLAARPGIKFTEPQIKCYMQQLLRGLEHCHGRGVLHRDIKGSNLLIDNNGVLKIGDFGLATFFRPDMKQPLTSRVVTLWYRPPELLLGATEYGVAVDLWGTGCILAELFAGKPIMTGRTEVEQLHKIFKLCGSPSEEYWRKSRLPHATIFKPQHPYKRCVPQTYKDFPSSALALIEVLLAIEPESRGSAASALKSDFFTTNPLPCYPSNLPKYPPSKEFDAKLRDEEARRQIAEAVEGYGAESARSSRKSRAVPSPSAIAEVQKRQGQSNPKSNSEKYDPQEDSGSGFPIEPPRDAAQHLSRNKFKENQTMVGQGRSFVSSPNFTELRTQRSHMRQGAADLSNFSRSVNTRSRSKYNNGDGRAHQQLKARYNQLDDVDPSERHELSHYLLDRPTSSHRKGERVSGKESAMATVLKKNRIHHSGPLLPSRGNIDEMLKEHERHIQEAVRKARLDKAKTKKNYGDNRRSELLHHGKNGR